MTTTELDLVFDCLRSFVAWAAVHLSAPGKLFTLEILQERAKGWYEAMGLEFTGTRKKLVNDFWIAQGEYSQSKGITAEVPIEEIASRLESHGWPMRLLNAVVEITMS